jgi:hypothetical protein
LGKAASAAAGGIASGVGSSIFSQLAHWWADAYKSLLGTFSAAFLHAGDVSLAQYQASGLWKLEVGIGMVLAAGGIIWAGARTGWTRSGEPVATALAGLAKAVVGTGLVFTVVMALMAAADSITRGIMTATAGSTAAFASKLGALSAAGAGQSTALIFLFSLLGVIITALLWIEMLIRAAGLIIVTMTAPIGAGGLVSESTAGWWRKLVAAELALIVIKPVIALVLGVGFTAVSGASGVEGLLVGLMILAAASFAWPTVARLFTFFGSQVASFGLGGALGLAGGLAAARGGGGGGSLAQGQPMWQTLEQAGRRTSNPSDAPLGGQGASGVGAGSSPAGDAGGSGGVSELGSGAADVAGGAEAASAGAGGAGAGAGAAAAGPVGAAAAAGLAGAKKAAEMPGHMLSHAGDMAGVDGSGAASPMLAPPAKSASGGAASPGQGVPPDVLAQMQREGATPPEQVPPASPGPQGSSWQDLSAQGGQG